MIFLGLKFWPKVIFLGLCSKCAVIFWGCEKKPRGIYWVAKKGLCLRDFFGYAKKGVIFLGRQILKFGV